MTESCCPVSGMTESCCLVSGMTEPCCPVSGMTEPCCPVTGMTEPCCPVSGMTELCCPVSGMWWRADTWPPTRACWNWRRHCRSLWPSRVSRPPSQPPSPRPASPSAATARRGSWQRCTMWVPICFGAACLGGSVSLQGRWHYGPGQGCVWSSSACTGLAWLGSARLGSAHAVWGLLCWCTFTIWTRRDWGVWQYPLLAPSVCCPQMLWGCVCMCLALA